MNLDHTHIIHVLQESNKIALEYYNSDFDVYKKKDKTFVTKADIEVDKLIINELSRYNIDIITEETSNRKPSTDYYFLIDPIDGTQEFVERTGDFGVCIGLCYKGTPVQGFISRPTTGEIWLGDCDKKIAKKILKNGTEEIIRTSNNDKKLTVVTSKNNYNPTTNDVVKKYDIIKNVHIGSCLKFTLVAEGKADLYIRDSVINAWDVMAGFALVVAAGGEISGVDNKKINHYVDEKMLTSPFIAHNGKIKIR